MVVSESREPAGISTATDSSEVVIVPPSSALTSFETRSFTASVFFLLPQDATVKTAIKIKTIQKIRFMRPSIKNLTHYQNFKQKLKENTTFHSSFAGIQKKVDHSFF